MMFKRTYIQFALAFICGMASLTLLAGQGKAAEPVKGGTVAYLSSKIPSLNPLHSAYEVGLVTSQIFASLVRMDENNEIAPYLAESWEVSNAGKTYTFHLAKNAKFHEEFEYQLTFLKFQFVLDINHFINISEFLFFLLICF